MLLMQMGGRGGVFWDDITTPFQDDEYLNWRTVISVIIWPQKLQDMLSHRTGGLVSFIL